MQTGTTLYVQGISQAIRNAIAADPSIIRLVAVEMLPDTGLPNEIKIVNSSTTEAGIQIYNADLPTWEKFTP